jgi:hypothetical protein
MVQFSKVMSHKRQIHVNEMHNLSVLSSDENEDLGHLH